MYISVPLFLHLWFGENHVLKYVPVCMLAEIWNNINLYFGSNSNVITENFKLDGPGGGLVCMVSKLE